MNKKKLFKRIKYMNVR